MTGDPDALRRKLAQALRRRESAERDLEQARADLGALMGEVSTTDGITMTEAAVRYSEE